MTDDLITFVHARFDDDERIARAVSADPLSDCWFDCTGDGHSDHHLRWDPARVLAEVDAKRRILDGHDQDIHRCEGGDFAVGAECRIQRLLALPFAGDPDYDPAWRP